MIEKPISSSQKTAGKNLRICAACGAESRRKMARFCLVCGKSLFEAYQPLDSIRASYRLQGKRLKFKGASHNEKQETKREEPLFEESKNGAAEIAWACLVYSLVPYLGILFTPGALFMGGVGIFTARNRPYLGGGRTSIYSILLGLAVLGVQLLLWWLLYLIPTMDRHF